MALKARKAKPSSTKEIVNIRARFFTSVIRSGTKLRSHSTLLFVSGKKCLVHNNYGTLVCSLIIRHVLVGRAFPSPSIIRYFPRSRPNSKKWFSFPKKKTISCFSIFINKLINGNKANFVRQCRYFH